MKITNEELANALAGGPYEIDPEAEDPTTEAVKALYLNMLPEVFQRIRDDLNNRTPIMDLLFPPESEIE